MIPDMTTGIRLYERLVGVITGEGTFMMSSGLKVPTPAMLMPAFAVPYAAPIAIVNNGLKNPWYRRISSARSVVSTTGTYGCSNAAESNEGSFVLVDAD